MLLEVSQQAPETAERPATEVMGRSAWHRCSPSSKHPAWIEPNREAGSWRGVKRIEQPAVEGCGGNWKVWRAASVEDSKTALQW